ncbi:MAG: hypothetical protein K2L46_04800, partial [Paramuribaculum sp.]|nr:hypothetical protein [Paramuribaculum sp.]
TFLNERAVTAIADFRIHLSVNPEIMNNFAIAGHRLATTYEKIRKRYAHLAIGNLRNFLLSKDSIMVLTRIAWAAIVTSAHRLSQGLLLGSGIVGSRIL